MKNNQADLFYPADRRAVDRLPFSPLHHARTLIFMPWLRPSPRCLTSYAEKHKGGREIALENGSVVLSGALWRQHRNFLNHILANLEPTVPDGESGDARYYYENTWIAAKLGYQVPHSAGPQIDKLVRDLQTTTLEYKIHRGVHVKSLPIGYIPRTSIIRESATIDARANVAGVSPGMRYIDISGRYLKIFEQEMALHTTPETIDAISSIDNPVWQSMIELALSQSKFFNYEVDDALTILGITRKELGSKFYSVRDQLTDDAEARRRASEVFGLDMRLGRQNGKQVICLVEDKEYFDRRELRMYAYRRSLAGRNRALDEPFAGPRPKFWTMNPPELGGQGGELLMGSVLS